VEHDGLGLLSARVRGRVRVRVRVRDRVKVRVRARARNRNRVRVRVSMIGWAFAPSDAVYSSPKRSGRLKSAWTVEHCHSLLGLGLGLGTEHCHSLYYVGWRRRTISWVSSLTLHE